MNKEQVLARIETLIKNATNHLGQGIAIGYITACFDMGFICMSELITYHDRALGLVE